MRFEWTESKRNTNLEKHGIDFAVAIRSFEGPHVVFPSDRNGEQRFGAIGLAQGRIITLIYHDRGDMRRIISARRARKDEEKDFRDSLG